MNWWNLKASETTWLDADNQPIQGRIRIVNKDALTGDLLAGAEFTITRISGIPAHNGADDGEVVATLTTGTDGTAESPLLTYGTYRITETKAPDHFVLADFSTDVTISEDNMQPIEVVVENEPTRGYIRLTKTDSLAGRPIAGVQFDIFDASGDLSGTMTTDDNGVAVSPALPKGSYTVREHENPVGYVVELVELPAVVYSDETTDLAVTNDPIQGKIRIVKKDQLTGDLLAGAEFTITRISGIPAHNGAGNGEVVAVITTNENGVAESPLLTYGTYKIEETVVPEHFVDNGFSVEVTISDDNLKTYVRPRIGENQFGGSAITYMGTNAAKQWARLESYGPKFVENIVQAISRDILCYAMQALRDCAIVAHVHDEVILEADPGMSLEAVCERMGRTPPWAQGLLLRADGYATPFYKKD